MDLSAPADLGKISKGGRLDVETLRATVGQQAEELAAGLQDADPAALMEILPLVNTANSLLSPYSEQRLRAEGRVHGKDVYRQLGFEFTGEEPPITEELVALCAGQPVRSMLVLTGVATITAISKRLRRDFGFRAELNGKARRMYSASATSFQWVTVPMVLCRDPETIGRTKREAVDLVQHSPRGGGLKIIPPGPEAFATGILLHYAATREVLFRAVSTFTGKAGLLIGDSNDDGFWIRFDKDYQAGDGSVGLAPVGIMEDGGKS